MCQLYTGTFFIFGDLWNICKWLAPLCFPQKIPIIAWNYHHFLKYKNFLVIFIEYNLGFDKEQTLTESGLFT